TEVDFCSMTLAQFIPAIAAAVAATAAVTGVRDHRIPNRITYPAMIAGFFLQGLVYGWRRLLLALGGCCIFGGTFLLFYLIRAMGAGDVKLAAALGCIIGPAASVRVLFFTALAGGIMAVVVMIATGRTLQTLRNTLAVAGFH